MLFQTMLPIRIDFGVIIGFYFLFSPFLFGALDMHRQGGADTLVQLDVGGMAADLFNIGHGDFAPVHLDM